MSVIRLMVNPMKYMMTKAPRIEFGMAIPVMMVERTFPRKK